MTWVRLDDQFADHPKVTGLSCEAFRLHITAMCWTSAQLTDGVVPFQAMRRLGWFCDDPQTAASELVESGAWDLHPDGYTIHDYLDYNPSREQVQKEREIAKRRTAMNTNPDLAKAVKERDGNYCRYCGTYVNWQDRKGERGGTYDHVMPLSKGGDEDINNLVTCCRKCNLKKGAKTPEGAGMILMPPRNNLGDIKVIPEGYYSDIQTSPSPSPSPESNTRILSNSGNTEVAPSGAAPVPDPVPEPVVEPEPAPEPKPKKSRAVPEGGQSDMFGAIAEACDLDTKLKAGQIAKAAKSFLQAGYTPAQVRAFPVWWQIHDWRGQRGDVPTLTQLTEKIKQSTNGVSPPLPPRNGNGNWQTLGERQSADYQRKMAALLGD